MQGGHDNCRGRSCRLKGVKVNTSKSIFNTQSHGNYAGGDCMPRSRVPSFKIHPSVVLQLGADLIADRTQALLELVKNCYDADSPDCNISIDTHAVLNDADSFFPGAVGRIVVEDSGSGMNRNAIDRGWLTISNSHKREMKEKGRLTPSKKRTPLGDKGLGRLGTQILGENLEIYTCSAKDKMGYHIGISWKDFRSVSDLSTVPVRLRRIPKRKGTRLVVSNIYEPTYWDHERDQLEREISQLFFSFDRERAFSVGLSLNGARLDIRERIEKMRNTATFRYTFGFNGQDLTISGLYRLNYLESASNRSQYQRHIVADNGSALLSFLEGKVSSSSIQLAGDTSGFSLRTCVTKSLRTMDKVKYIAGVVANPGPFTGTLDYYELSGRDLGDGFGTVKAYRDFVKGQSGVRVYRDGFAIRPYGFPETPGHDWLGFGMAATSGHGQYSMKTQNAVGYVSISAKDNKQLTEIASREGFQDTPYAQNFRAILTAVVDHINRVNGELREGSNKFLELLDVDPLNVKPTENMRAIAEEGKGIEKEVIRVQTRVTEIQKDLSHPPKSESVKSNAGVGTQEQRPSPEVNQALLALSEVSSIAQSLREYLQRVHRLSSDAEQVEREVTALRQQLNDFTELASLGLTAEAFSHELSNVTDQLNLRTSRALDQLKASKEQNFAFFSYAAFVRTIVSSIRKQLSHLLPSLRYVREQRDMFSVREFLSEHISYHQVRLNNVGIEYSLEDGTDFSITMNRGKLIQVMDNLILNAEYWLKTAREAGVTPTEIHVALAPPFIQVWDTGFGIEQAYEHTLFNPFVTGKPRNTGRGLGLFIVRQLLDTDECHISLLPARNSHERRYIFQLDMSGAITE